MSIKNDKINKHAALFAILAVLCLLLTTADAQAKLPIGAECTYNDTDNNVVCASGDCEESDIPVDPGNADGPKKWYCDCDSEDDCAAEYGTAKEEHWDGDWDCNDGKENTNDLDYCVQDKGSEFTDGETDYFFALPPVNAASVWTAFLDSKLMSKSIKATITEDINDKLGFRIPGLNFTKLSGQIDEDGYLYIPWLGEYIKAIYNYALGIISIVAVLMIILQGARIITSGGGEGKQEGFKKIGHVGGSQF